MYRNEKECLCNLLDCGIDDLEMIKNCKYDLRELVNRYIRHEGEMPDINWLIEDIFLEGLEALDKDCREESERLWRDGVSDTVGFILPLVPHLDTNALHVLDTDFQCAESENKRRSDNFAGMDFDVWGMDYDKKLWFELWEAVKSELERRSENET